MKIDDTQDYSSDIAQLDKDTDVAQLYLDEAEENCRDIRSRHPGMVTITAMDHSLLAGVLNRAAIL